MRTWLKCLRKDNELIFRAIGENKVLDRSLCGQSVSNIVKLSVVKASGQQHRK